MSLDDSGSAPPSMAPPPLPPDYGASGVTPQGAQGAGLGAWQAPSSGNSFNSAGPALATPSNNDDWDDPWANSTPQQQQQQQQQQDWNADVSIKSTSVTAMRLHEQLTTVISPGPPGCNAPQ